jgi:ABC-type multidrug transport system fused ATPase/permease subunit
MPQPTSIEPLPEATVGEIVGLLEYLDVRGGREDIFRIAADTNSEFGRVLSIVEGAELLDFVDTPKRMVVLEPEGQKFVRAAVDGVIHEAILAGCLTALMILLFLGSWRSTLIIAVTIPLAILTSIIALFALGVLSLESDLLDDGQRYFQRYLAAIEKVTNAVDKALDSDASGRT